KLMDYVKTGGNLVVQYNTNSRFGPVPSKIGPYPFTISRDRVTDETAEVRMINITHPALNFPNKITINDFDGWIQERGIYFAGERDSVYQTVLSMNDAGEKPLDGSLIIAKYGKGNFVYTGLVFFRELPAGIPGAYRLFVNLLSLPRNDK
ncbi:MAG: LmbE family protein, partial [Bacteroidia bacterium]|nr:LmbE family protein [Bacteroidia bacterium]